MIFSGQRLGQDPPGRAGQPTSTTAAGTVAGVSPVAGIANGAKQAILPAKATPIAPASAAGSSVTGTSAASAIDPLASLVPVSVAKPPVVGVWIGNQAAKPVSNQVVVNKWQAGLVARSSEVAKSVGNPTGKGQNGVGQNGKGPAARPSSSWW